jgi:hypothetical protein
LSQQAMFVVAKDLNKASRGLGATGINSKNQFAARQSVVQLCGLMGRRHEC